MTWGRSVCRTARPSVPSRARWTCPALPCDPGTAPQPPPAGAVLSSRSATPTGPDCRRRSSVPEQMSNYAVCYECLRIYRSAVLRIARERLQRAHPSDWSEVVKRPFQSTWDQMVRNAHERRVTGEIGSELSDNLDYIGVSQFHSLFEHNYDVLFPLPSQAAADDRTRTQRRQAILSWARECRAMRDPIAHDSEADLEYEDAFRLADSARRILDHLGTGAEESSTRLRDLARELQGAPLAIEDDPPQAKPPLDGYLPDAIAPLFFGRQEELDALKNWLDNDRARGWALMGAGGTGKSAIAYEFARRLREEAPEPFHLVVWLSAKRRRFLEREVVEIPSPDVTDLSSALDFLLLVYGEFEPDAERGEEQADLALRLLDEFPALVVLDDLDSLEGMAEDAIEFFTIQAATTRSRVLITSRRQLFGWGARTTVVQGFREDPGRDFVRSRIDLFRLDPAAFSKTHVERILKVTDGSPLFIEDLLRLCAVGVPISQALQQWTSEAETGGRDVRAYALKRELEKLGDDAADTIVAAAVPDRPASLAELRAVTGLPEERLHAAVAQLQQLFLMPAPGIIQGEERFELNTNTRYLVRAVWENTDQLRRAENGFRSLSDESVVSSNRQRRIDTYVIQAVALVRQDRHEDAERTLLVGLGEYPNEVGLLAQLGWVYRRWKPKPRFADARTQFIRSHELRCTQAEMYRHWSELEVESGEYEAAACAAEVGLELIPNNQTLQCAAGRARSLLGRQLVSELQPGAANQLLRARDYLHAAIRDPSELRTSGHRRTQSFAYRSLILTLQEFLRFRGYDGGARNMPRIPELAREALRLMERWSREHPDDIGAQITRDRYAARFAEAAVQR